MFKVKIVYKFALIVLLAAGLLLLGYSGFKFACGDYSEFLMLLHRICGFALLVVAMLHIIIKRRKLVKLFNEFLDVVLARKNPSFCNMDRLVMALENHTIQTIADTLRIDADELVEILKDGEVKFDGKNQTLRDIARLNDEKIFYTLVLIVEAKFGDRSQKFRSCNI